MGYDGVLTEGADHILGYRSPNFLHRPPHAPNLKMLLKNYRLSDDIAFRFSNKAWEQWPLTAEKFARWVNQINGNGFVCNLFMDYETFGEHQWTETGIFAFMEHMPREILKNARFRFRTPSEVAEERDPVARLSIPHPVSWADVERDLTAWLGNPMQFAANDAFYALRPAVLEAAKAGAGEVLDNWRKLATSDHLYYMCTKWFSDGDVHKYFSPYASPHDAFIAFMNVLDDLKRRAEAAAPSQTQASGKT
jgi:alpha-amylase